MNELRATLYIYMYIAYHVFCLSSQLILRLQISFQPSYKKPASPPAVYIELIMRINFSRRAKILLSANLVTQLIPCIAVPQSSDT